MKKIILIALVIVVTLLNCSKEVTTKQLFNLLPRDPRWLNKIVANTFGYFWLPCPICDEPFAGFEWVSGHTIYRRGQYGKGVCYKPECSHKAEEMSDYNPYDILLFFIKMEKKEI